MGISWANWICEIGWDNKPFRKAWALEGDVPISDQNQMYRSIGPYLVALIKRLEAEEKTDAAIAAKNLFYALEDRFLEGPPAFGHGFQLRDLLDHPDAIDTDSDTLSGK
jgi:hypothetical protein